MTNLIQIKPSISIESREVAEMVGKQHNELLKDIRRFISYLGEGKITHTDFFVESEYLTDQNKKQPCFLLTKQGCEMVANKLTGKKGTLFTARYVMKFNEMESQQTPASYMIADPIARANKWIEEQREKQLLEQDNQIKNQLIAEYEPKITYLDEILNSKDTLLITAIAADYGMSARELNKILAKHHIQRYVDGQWILYKEHMNKGYTKSKTHQYSRSDSSVGYKLQTKWTQKGRLKIHELLESLGYTALVDEQIEMEV